MFKQSDLANEIAESMEKAADPEKDHVYAAINCLSKANDILVNAGLQTDVIDEVLSIAKEWNNNA